MIRIAADSIKSKTMHRFAKLGRVRALCNRVLFACVAAVVLGGMVPRGALAQNPIANPGPRTVWPITIVLPPRLVAGSPATLAVTDAEGKLVSGTTVELGSGERVSTDRTGRAYFTAPASAGVLLAKGDGVSAAVLVDPPRPNDAKQPITVAPDVSLRDRFAICGGGLRGDADAYQVTLNGEPGLVLAASPECVVVLAGAKTAPGRVDITLEAGKTKWTANTSLVSLEFEPPKPALQPEQKGKLIVRVHGSERKLDIVVGNRAPKVLQFARGDPQELQTSGGPQNLAEISVKAVRSGDFSFRARLASPPDVVAARGFLLAAAPLAPAAMQREIRKMADRLQRHPRDFAKIRLELAPIVAQTAAGDLHTLLAAAEAAL
jgi:hypothetical protein